MRTKVTLVLIFLNVALFYFIFYMRGVEPPVDKSGILGPEVSNIQSLVITNAAGETLTQMDRQGDKWLVTAPIAWPANKLAVSSIINELQFLRPISTFAVADLAQSSQTLADFGLEKPPFTLSFTPAAIPDAPPPQPIHLRIGKFTPDSSRLYILSRDGQSVHVVSRSLAENLARTLQTIRSDQLFTIPVFEARSLNLEPAGRSRIRFRRENDSWFIEGLSASQTRASKANTVLALGSLLELKVHQFFPTSAGEAARAALVSPALRITVEGNNRRETLLIGPPAPPDPAPAQPAETPPAGPEEPATLYYAVMEGDETGGTNPVRATLFTVSVPDRFLKTTLLNAQRELREKQILDINPAAISSITLSSPQASEEVVLQRLEAPATSNAWQIVRRTDAGLQTASADPAIVERLIADLLRLSAEGNETDSVPAFIDVPSEAQKEAFGFTRPIRTITLTTSGPNSATPTRLLIGSGQDRHAFARLATQETIYHVSSEIIRDTPVDPLYYRQRFLRELPANRTITALKLTNLANDAVLLETALPLPEDTRLDRDAIDALTAQLRTLRAKNLVSSSFTKTVLTGGEERPWKYRLDATLSSAGGAEASPSTSTLFFADRTGGDLLLVGSSDPGLNVVFEAEQPLIDAFFKLTFGPRDPGPGPAPAPPPAASTPAPSSPAPTSAAAP